MAITLENFQINRLVVHEVFKREVGSVLVSPTLNEQLTVLNANGLRELQDRAIQAIGHKSHSIEMDFVDMDRGSVYSCIEPFLTDDKDDGDFIQMSHRIVTKLVESQTSRVIPGGVVLIFQGTTGTAANPCLGIIKADKHSGFTIDSNDQVATVEYLSNLMLTPEQKLYKIALAVYDPRVSTDGDLGKVLEVCIFDADNNKANSKAAAV